MVLSIFYIQPGGRNGPFLHFVAQAGLPTSGLYSNPLKPVSLCTLQAFQGFA